MASRRLALGIETSCDDTACAVVDGEGRVLSSVVSSQLEAHRPFGGVVPEIASREHLRNWPEVSAEALERAGVELAEIDLVAATRGPGLIGALLVGLSLGRALAWARGLPFHGVHHLEGHLYSPFLRAPGETAEPQPERFVGLVLSGGHSAIYGVAGGDVGTLAETRDDAMGEVFDKLGKRLGLPYPQGPEVDELAEAGEETGDAFTLATCADGSLDFSFSGLKSQALRRLERLEAEGWDWPLGGRPNGGEAGGPGERRERTATTRRERVAGAPASLTSLLADFRAAAVAQVVDRLDRLAAERPVELVAVSGGVAANRLLRRRLVAWAEGRGVALRLVPLAYAGDNAAMIAWAAQRRAARGLADDPLAVDAASRIPMC